MKNTSRRTVNMCTLVNQLVSNLLSFKIWGFGRDRTARAAAPSRLANLAF